MLWTLIRDFFVQYIFGGTDSFGAFYNFSIGDLFIPEDNDTGGFMTNNITALELKDIYGNSIRMSLGDWLSTTATIICMVLISICFILLVRWLFKAVASAFLLK